MVGIPKTAVAPEQSIVGAATPRVADIERPTADDPRWTPEPESWPSSRPVLALVVETLPKIEASLAADLVEHLALALVDRDDELRAVRAVLSAALTQAHTQQAEIARLRARNVDLHNARRQEKLSHPQGEGQREKKLIGEVQEKEKERARGTGTGTGTGRGADTGTGRPWT